MKVETLQSITEIKPEDCYQTNGSKPVKVFCDDLNYYVCKYNTGRGFPVMLFNEYLAACFLKIWQLDVPDFAFVNIKKEHVNQTGYPYYYFDVPCFGSQFYGAFKEVDKLFLETPGLKNDPVSGKESFLKIGLFDIWMSNEDRHYENFNLLYNLKAKRYVPIDHAMCFNSGNLDKAPQLISNNESILTSPFINRFFYRPLQQNFNNTRLSLLKEFKLNASNCREDLDTILANIPIAWRSNSSYLRSRLEFLFSESWINACAEHFTTLLTLTLKPQEK